jgi:hypothetical protein
MINHDYVIDTDKVEISDSGGQCDYLYIKNEPHLGFKSFAKKNKAQQAYRIQKKLAKLDLAPKLFSGICRLAYYYDPKLLEFWNPTETITGWGFITERAVLMDYENPIPYKKIQDLVDSIWDRTKMKFWDCHENNVGYIKRGRFKKLVCIDTGKESFQCYANAWGFEQPGPKCSYCLRYQCKCSEY